MSNRWAARSTGSFSMSSSSMLDGGARISESQKNLRIGIAIAVTLSGFLVVAAGVVLGRWTSFDDVWSSVLIEVGAGVALVALIVFFEDKMVHQQTVAVEERIEQWAEEVLGELSSRVDEVESSLADLNARVEQARRTRYEAQDEAVRAIQEHPTAANVARALGVAADLRAIAEPLIVQASGDRSGIRVLLHQHLGPLDDPNVVDLKIAFPGEIGPIYGMAINHADAMNSVDAMWTDDEPPEDLIVMFEEKLQLRNQYEPGLLDAEVFFSNLVKTLETAIQSRRRDGAHVGPLQGRVIEKYSNECFITTAGIECPSHRFLQKSDESLLSDPPAPEFISPRDWRFLVDYAIEILGVRPPAPELGA